jgi:hypothetical protein
MKRLAVTLVLASLALPTGAQDAALDRQLAAAVLPLPTDLREGAGAVRWAGPGELERLRPSSNGMSCTVDDPDDDTFDVRCYHDDFWTVIVRARQLGQTLESRAEVDAAIAAEVESGALAMPAAPTAGYRMLGPIADFDADSLAVGDGIRKWQSVHFPFRTTEEMGLTEARELSTPGEPGHMPFVMSSGTWWSHVMIVHEAFR